MAGCISFDLLSVFRRIYSLGWVVLDDFGNAMKYEKQ